MGQALVALSICDRELIPDFQFTKRPGDDCFAFQWSLIEEPYHTLE
jgi:hypothetical protein